MTHPDMFIDYNSKIKVLKQKLKLSVNISNDLEVIIESQKKEIDTLKQIIDLQTLQIKPEKKTRTDKIFQLKNVIKKCREKGKFGLAIKIIDKYKIDRETLQESYYD